MTSIPKNSFLLVFLFINIVLYGRTLEKTYYFSAPLITNEDSFSKISFAGTTLFGEPGKPLLPFQPVMLMLPPGEEAISITLEYLNPSAVDGNFQLSPGQAYRPLSYNGLPEFILDKTVYQSSGPFPDDLPIKVRTHFMNGYGFAVSSFTPVSYLPSEGKITYYRQVKVTLQTAGTERAANACRNLKRSGNIRNKILDVADNPGMIVHYTDGPNPSRSNDYHYLIITGASFAEELDTLIGFYKQRGIISKCYTLDYIDTAATGMDMAEKMRNFIIEEYQDRGIEYVLLGGDVEVVPYRGFYCTVQSSVQYSSTNIPSDLYFSALDGTWNDDNDNLWGEPGEDDLLPEVAVGRLTFSDTAELHNMLHKVIMYQQAPVENDLKRPLLAGEHLFSDPITWGSDYMRLLIDYQTYNGYTTTGIPPDHDIDSLYDRYSYWSKQRLMDSINNGRSFIHHVGHANSGYVMKLYKADITNSNFSQVNGVDHNYPLIYTHGCICGGFDYSDCIAEKMIGIDNFAVAFVGNSRYGWFVEGTADGPSQHLHREFVDALYSDSLYRLGMAHMKSKIETAPFVDLPGEYEPGAHRWCFYDCNVLGDPMLAIWTDIPHDITVGHPPFIMAGADTVTISVGFNGLGQKGMVCGLFQADSLLGSGMSDSTGVCNIVLTGTPAIGEASLVISGFNVLPHDYTVEVTNYWIGITANWSDPQNWYNGQVPDSTANIIIPADPPGPYFPVFNTANTRECRGIFLEPGALLHVGQNDTLILHGD